MDARRHAHLLRRMASAPVEQLHTFYVPAVVERFDLAWKFFIEGVTTYEEAASCEKALRESSTRMYQSVRSFLDKRPPPWWVSRGDLLGDLKLRLGARVALGRDERRPPEPPSGISTSQVPPDDPAPFDITAQDLETKEGRRRAVDAFLAHGSSASPYSLRRNHIWRAAGYDDGRSFEYWQEMSPRATKTCDKNIRRILAMSVPDFLDLLRRKRLIENGDARR